MAYRFSFGTIMTFCALATPQIAAAQPAMICGQRAEVIARLHTQFGEERRTMGLSGHNRIIELFVSDRTGSWTITVTGLDGITCLIASGDHHETIPPGEPL